MGGGSFKILLGQVFKGGDFKMQFLMIDPVTRDYVFRNGSPIPTDDIRVRAYIALTIPRGAWIYGQSDQGSLLYKLDNAKRSNIIEQQFAGYAKDAIQQSLISQGYATDVGVNNIAAGPTGTSNQVAIVPTATPVQSSLNFVSV